MTKIFNRYYVEIKDKHGVLRYSSRIEAFDDEEAINLAWDAHIKNISSCRSDYLEFPLTFTSKIDNG